MKNFIKKNNYFLCGGWQLIIHGGYYFWDKDQKREGKKRKKNKERKKLGSMAVMRSKKKGHITCIESIFNLMMKWGATPKGKYL